MARIITEGDFSIARGPFDPTFDSLRTFEVPKWFADAKFGIWSHWGPQSVPMYGDWYARQIYEEGSDQNRYHRRHYGHPSEVGYKDIAAMWHAEAFDPESLMDLFAAAGAHYFVGQAMHHDNFDNFDSKFQPRFNSVAMGPKRDIVAAWQAAAQKRGLPFGLTEHLAASHGWFGTAKGCDSEGPFKGVPYDGNDEAYGDLYYHGNNGHDLGRDGWYTSNEEFHKHWFLRIKDVIDKYQPDLLYSDGPLPFGQFGLDIVAHLYNTSAAKHGGKGRAVYNQKDKDPDVFSIGVLDIERSQEDRITPYYWQTDTSVGDWFYNVRDVYKPWNVVVETIVDIASKNGNILLNILQKPDGTLDYECMHMMRKIAEWMAVNSEGVFGTRHWRESGEGPARFTKKEGGFDERALSWAAGDVRFTSKPGSIYAFLMRWPGSLAVVRSLNSSREQVRAVSLLGYGPVEFSQNGAALVVKLPDKAPSEFVTCLKIEI